MYVERSSYSESNAASSSVFLCLASAVTDILDTTSGVRSWRWLFPKIFLKHDVRYLMRTYRPQHIPGPPFKKLVYPTPCNRARGILEEVDDVVPKCFIIEVTIDGAPRRYAG